MFKRLLFLCVGVLAFTSILSANEKSTFHHPERNYSITFPADWSKKEDVPGIDVMYLAPPNKEDFTNDATVNVKTGPLPKEINLEKFYSVNVENLKKSFKDFKVIEEGERKINGVDSKFIVYTYDQSGMDITIRQYFLIKDNYAYLFTFGAESKYYKDFSSVFDEILASVKL